MPAWLTAPGDGAAVGPSRRRLPAGAVLAPRVGPMSVMPITCPVYGHPFTTPAAQVGAVAICPICGSSIVLARPRDPDSAARRATAADTTALPPSALETLRKARPFDRRGRAR
jgi:hypothetical protein